MGFSVDVIEMLYSGATVGAALRGRQWLENTLFVETGGHGVPPLQLDSLKNLPF